MRFLVQENKLNTCIVLHSLLGLNQKLMFDEVIHSHGSKMKQKKAYSKKYPSPMSPTGPGPTFFLSISKHCYQFLMCVCLQSFSRDLRKQNSKPRDEKTQATCFTIHFRILHVLSPCWPQVLLWVKLRFKAVGWIESQYKKHGGPQTPRSPGCHRVDGPCPTMAKEWELFFW